MGTKMGGMVAALALALLAGCATLSGPAPAPDAPANDPGVVAINSAGDAGLLCAIISIKGSAEDIRKAQLAVQAAQAVLSEPVPSYSKLSAALSEGMPKAYAGLSAGVLQRVKKRLGEADVIPDDTVAWLMASEFLTACGATLGETAHNDLPMIFEGLERLAG